VNWNLLHNFGKNIVMDRNKDIINPYVIPGLIRKDMPEETMEKMNRLKNFQLGKEELLHIISTEAGVSAKLVFSKCRESEYVFCRNIYTKIQKMYGKKLTEIGKDIDKDHTTIIHSLRQFDNRYTLEESYRNLSDKIFNKVGIDINKITNEYFNRTSRR
jgi:chromosomal replication initiation ATPase DnaA